MKKFKLLLVAQSLFCSTFLYSQDLPSFTPASPTASELGKYGQVPVGMFTGTLQYSIPLFEINQSNFKLPITLSYSSNGINVDKFATEVGMEWSLNAGGVITRILNDKADEAYRTNLPNYPFNSDDMRTFLHGVLTSPSIDTQPDVFVFNVNGYTGKFFLNDSLQPIPVEPSPLKIERLTNVTTENDFDFKLTDPYGVEYWFGGINATEESYSRSDDLGSEGPSPPSDVTDVAWYLSKIKLLNGKEIIFNYINYNFNFNSGISQTVTATGSNGQAGISINPLNPAPVINKSHSTISNLTSIIWDNGKVEFNYGNRGIGNNLLKLNNTKLYDQNNNLINGYNFEYIIATSDSNFSNIGSENNTFRLFLEKITPFDRDQNESNSYVFEYFSPNDLPPRLTYSRDFWGYFNGSANTYLVPSDLSFYDQSSYLNPFFDVPYVFRNVGGNRNSNGVFGIKGLLKKIIYPTKGFNSFSYEPHSYYGEIVQYIGGGQTFKSTSIQTEEEYGTHSNSVIVNDAIDEDVFLNLYVDPVSNCGEYDPYHTKATFHVYDITDVNNPFLMTFYVNPIYGGNPSSLGTSITIDDNYSNSNPVYVKLIDGHNYEFKVTINRPCLNAGLSFSHHFATQTLVTQGNIEVGGMRIKQIISNDDNGNSYSEDYYYGDLDCLTCSSGTREQIRPAISFFVLNNNNNITQKANLSSSTLNSLYFSQSYHIGYSSVVKRFNDNYNKGAIKYEYNVIFDNPPIINFDPIIGTPYTNGFGSGELLSEKKYVLVDTNLVLINEKHNNYVTDQSLQSQLLGYTAYHSEQLVTYNAMSGDSYTLNNYSLNSYLVNSKWRYLNQTIEKNYDLNGLNPIITTVNYFYENSQHLQATRTETNVSDGNTIIKKTYYPDDINSASSLGNDLLNSNELSAINLLKSPSVTNPNGQHRIVEPIQQESIIIDPNNMVLSKTTERTNYSNWQNNLVLPESIQTRKGEFSSSNILEDRIIFHKYNSFGNPLELSQANGTKIVYVWGYNDQYPVAKIENATYSEVESVLGVGFNLGNSGLTPTQESNLRTNTILSKAMVSTYTYDPLVGVTSMTDAKGYTMYYEYDEFNRLKHVKDKDGNILSENQYNYKQ